MSTPAIIYYRSLVKWMITAGYGPASGSSILSGPAILKHIAKTAESFCIAGVFYEEVSQRQYVSIWGIGVIGNAVDLHSTVRSSNLLFSTKVLNAGLAQLARASAL